MLFHGRGDLSPKSLAATVAVMVFLSALVGMQSAGLCPSASIAPTQGNGQNGIVSLQSYSQQFHYPISGIHTLIVYDLSTGAQTYANSWSSFLTDFGYNVSLLSIQLLLQNTSLSCGYDLVIVDSSCGGDHGNAIGLAQARTLAGLGVPLILLGAAHGVIDRLANYGGGVGQISATGIIQKAHDQLDHPIYSSPYVVAEAGFGAAGSIEIFSRTVSLESYPDKTIEALNTLALFQGAPDPVIGAFFSSLQTGGRIFWWSFNDPTSLNINGCHLFVNTVEWMGGLTDLGLLMNFLKGSESMDTTASTFWTGGYADYFEPEIPATYYAYSCLRFVGRIAAINNSALANWLTSYCYVPAQGYFHSPNRYLSPISWSGAVETGMALAIISELGESRRVNSSRISIYLENCQLIGGFVRYPGDTSRSLTNTYWALVGLNATGELTGLNRTSCISYILSCQNLNQLDTANYGGFADSPGAISSATSTYMALSSLKLLGAMELANLDVAEQWLMNGYVAQKGIFYEDHLIYQRYTVDYGTGYSNASLALIGRLQGIDQSHVAEYLSSVQFTDGGWSGANSTDESIDEVADCYPVMLGLQQMNQIGTIRDLDGFVAFVIRCLSPAPTYGFANLPRSFANVMHTYDGISILNDLGAIDSSTVVLLNTSIISSYHSAPSWFEFSRCIFPTSSDGYWKCSVELPYEFSQMQRDRRGVVIDDLAVSSLLELGSWNWVNTHARELWNEIANCEIAAGSSSGYYKRLSTDMVSNLTSGLGYTYHAINCLWSLAASLGYSSAFPTHLVNATMTINKIMSLYRPSTGSFLNDGYVIEPYSATEATYTAVASLSLLGGLSNVDYAKTAGFLQSHLYSNLVDTYYSFKGLEVLNKLSIINATRLVEFIKSCQKPSGAFQSDDNISHRLETTRMAIEILSHYNSTWLDAKPVRLVVNSFDVPPIMREGSMYALNVTVIDSYFKLNVGCATVSLGIGAYEFAFTETSNDSGRYNAHIVVPVDRVILGVQNLVIRGSKEKYETCLAEIGVEIQRGEGSANITMTHIAFTTPSNGDHLTTSNTSVTAQINALNSSQTPISGAQLQLYVDSSFAGNATSDFFGSVFFSWTPRASGAYDLIVVFQGASRLDASEVEKTITVDKTPTQLLTYSNCSSAIVVIGSPLQLSTLLSQTRGGRPIANEDISFIVLTPSGMKIELPATTGKDGVAKTLFTVTENGSYLVYSIFRATDYYSGCSSSVITLSVSNNSSSNGGNGSNSELGVMSWIDALLVALKTPLGLGLVVSLSLLLTTAYFMKTKHEAQDDSKGTRRSR